MATISAPKRKIAVCETGQRYMVANEVERPDKSCNVYIDLHGSSITIGKSGEAEYTVTTR